MSHLYFPASHEVHTEEPAVENVPRSQSRHVAEANSLYWPAAQLEQAENSTPVAALVRYLLATHGAQVTEAVPLYWPALQLEQTEDSSPVAPLLMCFPAGQLQWSEATIVLEDMRELNCQARCHFNQLNGLSTESFLTLNINWWLHQRTFQHHNRHT